MPKKNFIFTIVLIIALVVLGMSVFSISAEEEGGSEPEVIVTGDAEVVVEGENVVNSNIQETDNSVQETEDPLEESVCQENCEEEPIASESEEIVVANEVEVENNVEAEGSTGNNEIEEESECEQNSDDAVILTGNVNIYVGLINTVNSNIINSKLSELLYNIFNNTQGDIDVPDEVMENPEGCGEAECENIIAGNEGDIDNDVEIEGSSGNNSVETENGDAIIMTGDVNVVTNIFNVLNSNIIGSNWVRLIINIFGDWTGDLVLPGEQAMQNFVENSSSVCGTGCDSSNIVVGNEGEIENNVQVNANTGENSASGDDSTIITGTANVETNALNVANSNITHNNWFFMAINNFGNWQGNIFSMPPGFRFREDLNGIQIFNSGPNNDNNSLEGNAQNLVKDNSGSIENGVIINIDTGNNSANSENGSAGIATGNANAITDIVNVLNSNIAGTNWLLGMINIFGNWQGDVAFGRPDLWIGESVEVQSSPVEIDQTITYTLIYYNQGDAAATGVVLTDNFDERYLSVTDSGSGVVVDNPGEIQWDLGRIQPGEAGSVTYSARVRPDMLPSGITQVNNQATIDSFEDDSNDQDNTESFSISVIKRTVQPNPVLIYPDLPKLEIQKFSNPVSSVYAGNFIDYLLYIKNNSDSQAYRVVVTDILQNGEPEPLSTNTWNLDYVFPNETIIINYTVYIGKDVEPGLYTNTAQANGYYIWGEPIGSNQASVTIEVKAPEMVENTGEKIASGEASVTPEEQIGNVGIGEEIVLAETEETEENKEPEVLAAKTSGLRIRALPYFGFEFDDWIYIVLLVILGFAVLLFVVLYLLNYPHEIHNL